MTFDLVIHGWDLARAIGADPGIPEDVVDATYAVAQNFGDLSGSGVFGPAVSVPDDASTLDKLLGLTGRDPAWRPS
jgi:uncharacterized protein (TIGR03086 family)